MRSIFFIAFLVLLDGCYGWGGIHGNREKKSWLQAVSHRNLPAGIFWGGGLLFHVLCLPLPLLAGVSILNRMHAACSHSGLLPGSQDTNFMVVAHDGLRGRIPALAWRWNYSFRWPVREGQNGWPPASGKWEGQSNWGIKKGRWSLTTFIYLFPPDYKNKIMVLFHSLFFVQYLLWRLSVRTNCFSPWSLLIKFPVDGIGPCCSLPDPQHPAQ